MSNRDKLVELTARKDSLRAVAVAAQKDFEFVNDECASLCAEIVKTEDMLSSLEWEYSSTGTGYANNHCLYTSTRLKDVPRLSELYEVDAYGHYHNFYLWGGREGESRATLSFDDGEISIHFDFSSEDEVKAFVKGWKLKIKSSNLESQLEQLQATQEKLESVLTFVKETQDGS